MSNTSDQTTKQNDTTRLIVGEVGIDTETGIVGKGHSYDNGKTFTVDDTIYGRIYHADDHDKIWKGIQDQVAKVVAPAKSAADSAVSAADAAVASAQVTSDAVSAIASATAEAKQGANDAMSRAKSAWDVATGAKEAVTDFDPLLKSAQSDAGKALTQIADTASALSGAKTAFGSDVATAKELASTAQTTADSAVAVASDAYSNATVAIQTASGASLTAIDAKGDATIAKQTASEATVQASNAESDFAQISIRANKIEANVATNSGAIASVQQTANGLTTTVADIKANGGGVNLLLNSDQQFTNSIIGQEFVTTTFNLNDIFDKYGTDQVYTISYDLSSKDPSKVSYICAYTYPGTTPQNKYFFPSVQHNGITTTPQRFSMTFKPTLVDKTIPQTTLVFYGQYNSGNIPIVNRVKVEKGVVAHDWSPAPDDLQNQFTQIKTSINGVATTINDPKTGLNATYQTAQGNATTISNVKSDVAQLETTASGLTSRVGNLESKTDKQQTTIDQNKAAIVLKADQTTVNTLKGNVDQNTATLKTQSGQIQAKVSASDVSGMLTGYATQSYTQSLVTQTANKWNMNLTNLQTDVNAIKTTGGGVNLVQNTSTDIVIDATSSSANNFTFVEISFDEQPKLGDLLTISAEGTLTGTGTLDEYQVILFDAYIAKPRSQWGSLKAGKRDSVTLSLDDLDGNGDTVLLIYAGKYGETAGKKNVVHHLMVEEGTVAHAWSPAPSDMATVTSVTNLSATVDGIKSTVATKADQSTVTQLSNAIQSKVESSTYTSAISQLSDDINLRVKSADLISQINLQAGTALIQSNKLVLDSGTTIFTGEAFIPSAAISSIQADQIQIGNSRLFSDDGTFNLINQNAGTASIKLTTGNVQGSTQPVTEFSNGYNLTAMDISPVGTVIRPTLLFEDYPGQAKDTGFLGFSRRGTAELQFHTYDDTKELFRISCAARVNHDLHVDGSFWQGGLSIGAGNTIWSGSDYLAVGDHVSNSYTNVIAKSFSQQSTLSSKTNIETVDPKDALDLVNRTDIRSYQYKTDVAQGKTKRYTSLIIDDVNDVSQYYAPDEFTNDERTGRDDGSAVGYLFLAIKELTRRIKNLEEKLNG